MGRDLQLRRAVRQLATLALLAATACAPAGSTVPEARSTTPPSTTVSLPPAAPPEEATLAEPTEGFRSRVTLKPFGIRITPGTSPVQPERFSGYHTGADAEYGDVTDDVPVYAIAPGVVVVSRTATGYGGVMVLRHRIDGADVLALYGHLRASSMLDVGTTVDRGQRIAVLGKGFSRETDGERRHLHFAILRGSTVSLRGYVSSRAALSEWEDPVALLGAPGTGEAE